MAEGATHVAHCDKSRRIAFTLAEVLITLGIIGVVAALTLPTLIANYQKQVWVNQLKKTYSTLNEGVKQMVASEGCTTLVCAGLGSDESVDSLDFSQTKTKEKLVSTFKLENVYTDVLPDDTIYNYNIKYLSGEEGKFSDYIRPDYGLVGTTPSGEIMSFAASIYSGPVILVDINGLKSPNTFGRDIFVFSDFDLNDTVMVVPFYSSKFTKKFDLGMSEDDRIQTIKDDCSTAESADWMNWTCAEKIIMDGWKMTY